MKGVDSNENIKILNNSFSSKKTKKGREFRMKKVKKALLGSVIAGTLVAGAGAGTYAWFNADYKASGTITNHTLTINNSTTATETLDFGNEMLAPGRTVNDSFSFKNTGTLDQILRAGLDFQLKDASGNAISVPDKSKYLVTATVHFTRGGTTYNIGPVSGDAQSIDQYLAGNTWFPSAAGAGTFLPGDEVKVDVAVKLLETAGNEYQGKKLYGEVEIQAKQTDAGSQF
jgi:spore coat-associated protein N